LTSTKLQHMLLIPINLCGIFIIYQVIYYILVVLKLVHLHKAQKSRSWERLHHRD